MHAIKMNAYTLRADRHHT